MSWRTVVITGNAKLDYKMDYMGSSQIRYDNSNLYWRNWHVDH